MSDSTRQSLTEKAAATIKPGSQKTTCEGATDWVKGKVDSVASTLEPSSQKSTSQAAGDAISGNSNENQESLLSKAKCAVGMDK